MNPSKLQLIFLSIALLIICAASAAAQNSAVTVAPMQMRGWMPVVEVKLNGQGPFAFMIDTGAGMQADIDTSVAEQLNLQPSGRAINGDPSGENDREVVTVAIDSIMIGGVAKGMRARRTGEGVVEFRNVTAIVRPHKITKDYPDVDGILGFALFSDYLLTLDYPAMQVRLARGALPPANGADILTLVIENRVPMVELAIGKIKVPAHVDSGNFVAGFILPEEIVEQLQLLSQPAPVGSARSVNNRIELKQAQLRSSIRIGGFEYSQPTITFPALSDTNVGYKVLREFTLTFDQKNKRLKLERPAGTS
ncbi:MAG TPA: retropepsin-like aspartic protease [Pyrinomonadaceae bacterium]|nr:retropepsin-like aspartic protease [Pyrinomonadaceae bacterium]